MRSRLAAAVTTATLALTVAPAVAGPAHAAPAAAQPAAAAKAAKVAAHGDLRRAVAAVGGYRTRHGALPRPAAGNRVTGRMMTGDREALYLRDRRGWCVVVGTATIPGRAWLYDAQLDVTYFGGWARVKRRGGACHRIMDHAIRVSWQSAVNEGARGLGYQVEAFRTDGGTYPTTLTPTQARSHYVLTDQVRLGWYRHTPATGHRPASFALCVQHPRGGYAIYRSTRGDVVRAGDGRCR